MKIIKIMLTTSLLIGSSAMALSSKVKTPVVVKGTSVGKYAKPGAPVNIRYTSEHMDVGEISNVDMVFTSSVDTGTMQIKINIDKNLNELNPISKDLFFDLNKVKKEQLVHLEVSADNDGLYYVRVRISIEGKGMRAFAIPVYVGTGKVTKHNTHIEKTKSGENISVSKAEETVIH